MEVFFFLGLCLNFFGMEGRDDVTTTPGNAVAHDCFSDMLYSYTWKSPYFFFLPSKYIALVNAFGGYGSVSL